MRRSSYLYLLMLLALLGPGWSSGCAVPQPRGEGLYQYVKEPSTGAGYHLYLPVDYVKNNGRHPNPKMKKWPLVMTFHGMKPYDNALPQEREWEKEADFYGYIVCAPELRTSDSFMEYPLTREHSYVLDDKRNVIAIMDHVFATTLADSKKVLSTSWSCGGYLAHYFPNRYPERFTCIATRLSNFSAPLLLDEMVPRYRDRISVAIFIGDGDFPKCKSESEEAVAWYTARGFRVRGRMIDNMGHSRIPQTAAAFFAECIGLEPLHPVEAAATVAQVQMTEYNPPQEMIARFAPPIGTMVASARPSGTSRTGPAVGSASPRGAATTPATVPTTAPPRTQVGFSNSTAGRRYPANASPAYDPMPREEKARIASAEPAKPVKQVPPAQAQLASSEGARGNWLGPTGGAASPAVAAEPKPEPAASKTPAHEVPKIETTASNVPARVESKPAAVASPKPEVRQVEQRPTPTEKKSMASDTTRTTPNASRDAASRDTTPRRSETATVRPPSRPFSPGNAGRQYGPVQGASPASAANVTTARRTETPPAQLASGAENRGSTSNDAADRRPTDRVRRVNIKLGGPSIGTAPHYLRYEVDLPREVIAGSDFLWMDNGVWIGDEARGVKILESPGRHRISVLVVTADNIEYRGDATVHVLDRGPTAAAAN